MQELNRQMMTLPELRELEEIIRFGTGPAAVSGVLVLCGNETRARNFHRLLEERGVRARLDLSDQTLPAAR